MTGLEGTDVDGGLTGAAGLETATGAGRGGAAAGRAGAGAAGRGGGVAGLFSACASIGVSEATRLHASMRKLKFGIWPPSINRQSPANK